MGFSIMFDKDGEDPVNIHEDSCKYYTDRKQDATTTVWCQTDTLDDAETLAGRLAVGNENGCKHAACCLDGKLIE